MRIDRDRLTKVLLLDKNNINTSATIAVGEVMWALPEELFSAERAKCIGDQLANLLSANYPNANRSRQTYKSTSTR